MGCLPLTGGCEQRFIDPFVNHLNLAEGAAYSYVSCPDQDVRDQPQPDGLYADAALGQRLVIERKTMLWPEDHVEGHKADHFLMDLILAALGPLTADAPYELTLSSGISLDRSQLKAFALEIAEKVKAQIGKLEPGCSIGSSKALWSYQFTHQEDGDRDYTEPCLGLKITLLGSAPEERLAPSQLMTALCDGIQKCLLACEKKFLEYADERKILLVDPHGELRHLPFEWWDKALCGLPRPFPISEIWLGMFDMVSDVDEGWIFEKVYPIELAERQA